MFCVNAEKFYQGLMNLANNSNLPISLVYFIAQDFYNQVKNLYIQELQKEQSGQNKQLVEMDITPEMFDKEEKEDG